MRSSKVLTFNRFWTTAIPLWHDGLSRAGYGRYYAGQLGDALGRTHLRRFALVDRGEVLASAKLYTLDASLDGRPLRVAGIGALFTRLPTGAADTRPRSSSVCWNARPTKARRPRCSSRTSAPTTTRGLGSRRSRRRICRCA